MSSVLKSPVPRVDQVGVEERASAFKKRSIKKEAKAVGLKMAVSMMDLTTLEGADTDGKVSRLCRKARQPMAAKYDCPPCAAVCVYPNQVAHAVAELEGTGIPVASVATGFPAGLMPLPLRLEEIRWTVAQGADEIDIVITREHVLTGNWQALYDEVAAMREACGAAHMKAILATGDLQTLRNVYAASMVAMQAGADFIKTSTGKEGVNATLPVSLTMVRALRDYRDATGHMVGFKPAGGMKTAKDALAWQILMKEEMGLRWLQPDLFRLGASSMLGDLERQLEHHVTGRYAAAHRHALA